MTTAHLIDDIKDQLDLVELVEETTSLTKTGRAFTGFCPFHNNSKTPALVVWPDTATWKCFGCNNGGSVFDWVMQRDRVDFKSALESLAALAGMELTRSPEEIERSQKQATLKEALTFAAAFYQRQLWLDDEASHHALEARARRGFDNDPLRQLRWGFSRSDDGLMQALLADRPDLIPAAREYGLIRHDGRDFTANKDGDQVSPAGWIIYPHFERGNPAGKVVYLSSRAVSPIDKGSKNRNLPSSVELQPYLLLTGPSAADDAGRVTTGRLADDIFVVEGPADAATLWALGWPAAALMKQSFNPQFTWLKKYLGRAQGQGRKIYVALSNDEVGMQGALGQWKNGERQPGVCEDISPLADVLYWPKAEGADKADANSWFQAGGEADALRDLLAGATPFLNLMIEETATLTRQTRRVRHLAELVARLGEDDRADYINIISGNRRIKTGKAEFKKFIHEAMLIRNGTSTAVEITNGLFTDYGDPLASCLMTITHQQLVHAKSDEDVRIRYRITGKHPAGRLLKEVEILASEFEDFGWMAKHWGVDGYVMVGKNRLPKLRNAVINHSLKNIQREEIYSYTGWEIINRRRGFLTASGLLTAEGLDSRIKVELDGSQRHYRLPAPPDEVSLVDAILASLAFLEIGPDNITVPLLLAQYAAPLRPLQTFNALMILYGPSQAKKSNMSHLALSHWGDFLTGLSRRDYHTVIDAASTPFMLQQYNHILSDTVVVVDDVPPGSSTMEIIHQRKKVETLAREIGNRAGRERHGFASMPPNAGICMITAEKLAMQVGSAVGRSFTVEFTRDAIDVDRLTLAQQQDSPLYSQAMAGFVRWLAQNWEELSGSLPQHVRAFQQEVINRYSQPRLHDYYATLMIAGIALLNWARESNAIDELAETVYLQRFRAGIMANLDAQEDRIAEMQFSRRFFETLAAFLVQKPHALLPVTDHTDADETGQQQKTRFEPPVGTPLLGWRVPDAGQVWLHDDEALKQVKRHVQELGDFMDVSAPDLSKEMHFLGLLAEIDNYTRKGGRAVIQYKPKKKIPERGWTRVLVINVQAVRNLFDIDLLGEDLPEKT